jgi:lipopolysaccharide export system permease protein
MTAVVWLVYALDKLNLMTSYGRSILAFVWVTALYVPFIALVTAPFAFIIGVIYVLNRLNGDSELVVLHSSGVSPWRLFRPLFLATTIITLFVAFISFYLAPKGLQVQRKDTVNMFKGFVANGLQPGQFITLRGPITVHIRAKLPNGQFERILVDDKRDPKRRVTYLAERGEVIDTESSVILALENGTVHVHENSSNDPVVVAFDHYYIDLLQLTQKDFEINFGVRERFVWELANPDPTDKYYIRRPASFRNEFHDRITATFYPFVFTAIVFAFLSTPRKKYYVAIAATIAFLIGIRLIGLATEQLAKHALMYVVFLVCTLAAASMVARTNIARRFAAVSRS